MVSPANKLTQEVIKILNSRGNYVWRNNNLRTPGRKFLGCFGSSDIIGESKTGRIIGVEIKINDKLSPEQIEFGNQIKSRGGIYFIVHNLEELYNFINVHYQNI